MDNFVDFLANRVAMSITDIRNRAGQHHGTCTWHFSQCKDPVRTIIGKAEGSKDGICEILAAKWAALEVGGTTNLTAWLAGGGSGHRSQLDVARIALLAQTFATGSGKGIDQEDKTEAWLRQQGIKQIGLDMAGLAERAGHAKFDLDELFGDLEKRARRESRPVIGLLTLAEKNRFFGYKGHIMAFKLAKGGKPPVKYFDPNYGEFEFDTFANFKDWFRYYFEQSHYQRFMGTHYRLRYLSA
ncbi:MAG: YopT-type cysteine protease domain-containing protein [Sphingomonas fennica]